MWRSLAPVVVPILVVGAVAAHGASGDGDAAPAANAASANLRLPALNRCVRGDSVRVGLVPPAGGSFASLSVRLGEEEVLQLSGLNGPGSVVVNLPRGSSRVYVSGATSTGDFLRVAQTYRRCARRKPVATPEPTPKPPKRRPPVPRPQVQGGGED